MNIAEANALHKLLRSLETDASETAQEAGVAAAEYLAGRARTCLAAGPVPAQVGALVADVQRAVITAADHPIYPLEVYLGARTIQTAQPNPTHL